MKNTLTRSHKRYLRRLNIGIACAFCLFLGGLAFSVTNLSATPENEQLKPDKTVKGIILSADKKPMPGVVIKVKNSTTGTVTDINGVFSLDLKKFEEASLTLEISMVNYESKEVVIKTDKLPEDLGKITLKKEAE